MLDTSLKTQLASYMERITQPVEIAASLDDSAASAEMQALLRDIAETSKLVTVSESRGGPHRTPSFSINRPGENHGPRFAGLPMGHEFTSLVLALLQVGGYPPKVEQALLEQIRALNADLEFEVYVSLTCHNCPDVVQALNLMAVQNPRIKTTMIEGGLFQDEINERQIMGVPT
ncbi:MAG: thioredoxin family protein, partial [Ramlibacter sp.]